MPTPNPDYRENPLRAIYLSGEIGESSVSRLMPDINILRHSSQAPITLYIDSRGGNTFHSRVLYGLLKAPTQDNLTRRLITVATGTAASAAADLLAAGDYAIAYPHSVIHFHGTRQALGQQHVTKEIAASLAAALEETNESFALELANKAFGRFFFQYIVKKTTAFDNLRKEMDKPDLGDIECMAEILKRNVERHSGLPDKALVQHRRLTQLEKYLISRYSARSKRGELKDGKFEAFVLHCLIDYEMKENRRNESWTFSEVGLTQMEEDFFVLKDYRVGEHTRNVDSLIKQWGPFCLDAEQKKQFGEMSAELQDEWIKKVTGETVQSLWYFFVSICRSLQEGENALTAEEAYHFGLVDEVVGRTALPCFRMFAESREANPVPTMPEAVPGDSSETSQ